MSLLITRGTRPQRGPWVPVFPLPPKRKLQLQEADSVHFAFLSCSVPVSLLPSWAVVQAWPSLLPARCAASLMPGPRPENRGPFREGPRFLPPRGGWGSELGVVTISDPGVKG